MSSPTNPYASPVESGGEATEATVDFAPILRRWERLRLYYNVVLAGLVLAYTLVRFPRELISLEYWIFVLIGAAVANLCFTTGPAVEAYGAYFRRWHPLMTIGLFLAGLGLSAILALASVEEISRF